MHIRAARKSDAKGIAFLANMATSGVLHYCWRLESLSKDPWDVGEDLIRQEIGDYSYKNCILLISDTKTAALLNSFQMTRRGGPSDFTDYPPVIHPLARLEARTFGSWYINTLATTESFRKQGCAAWLLTHADDLARAAGVVKNSLIVRSGNENAHNLYKKFGFVDVAEEAAVPFEGKLIGEYWILMEKAL